MASVLYFYRLQHRLNCMLFMRHVKLGVNSKRDDVNVLCAVCFTLFMYVTPIEIMLKYLN